MANFKYYDAPANNEGVNQAYQMLYDSAKLQAEATGNVLTPFTEALKHGQAMKLQQRALDQREAEAKSEAAWKQRYGDIQEREIGMRENALKRDEARGAAFAKAIGGGRHQDIDEETARALGPELTTHLSNIFGRMDDDERQAQAAKQKADLAAKELADTNSLIDGYEKGGILTKQRAAEYRGSLTTGGEAAKIGTELRVLGKSYEDEQRDEGSLAALIKKQEALVKTAYGDNPEKMGEFAALKASAETPVGKAADRAKSFSEGVSKIHGVGKTDKGAAGPQFDIPGVAQNYTPNSSLKSPGEYRIDENGKPILPQDVDDELTMLARQALKPTSFGTEPTPADIEAYKPKLLSIFKWAPQGSGDPVSAQDPWASRGQRPVYQNSGPATPTEAAPQRSPLEDLTSEQRAQAVELFKIDPLKAREFMLKAKQDNMLKGSVVEPKQPQPPRPQREPNHGPF